MHRPWLWGVGFGVGIGGAVVLLSSLRYGLSAPLLLLGLVLVAGCGGLAFVTAIPRTRTGID